MLVKVRKDCDITPHGGPGTVHEVLCIDPSGQCFRLVGEQHHGVLYPRSYFHEGDNGCLWLECLDSEGSGVLRRHSIYPCLNEGAWRDGRGAELPVRPGFYFHCSRFKAVPYPQNPNALGGTSDEEPAYKSAMMAFFKKPSHADLCGSCGAPLPCRYHS